MAGFNEVGILALQGGEDVNVYLNTKTQWYEVEGYGYSRNSPIMGQSSGKTLPQTIRDLQGYYANTARTYLALERQLESARKNP